MRIKLLGATALVSLVAVGCGPPSVEDVSGAVRETVVRTTAQANSSVGTFENMPLLGDLGTVTSTGLMPRDAITPKMPDISAPKLGLPVSALEKLLPSHDGAEVAAAGERIAAFLETRVFTEENVEERTGDAIIFRVTGEDLCTDGTYPADASCVSSFDQFEVRLRATRPFGSIQVTLLMGPDRHEPFSLQMSNDYVAFSTDLAEVRETIVYVSAITGASTTGLPGVMEGRYEIRAAKGAGEHDFTLSTSVLGAIHIEYSDPNGEDYALTVAAGNDVTRLQFIEAERRVLAALNVPQVDVSFPAAFYEYDASTGTETRTVAAASLRLGGMSGAFDTTEGATELRLSNLGLGNVTSYLQIDGVQVYGVDVNASSGRNFDLILQRDLEARPVFRFDSELDVDVALNATPLIAYGQTVEAWAEQDQMNIRFSGGAGGPSYRHQPYDELTGFPGGERVLSGTLVLTTDEPGVAPVTVNEGQCLVGEYQYDDMGNPITGHPFAAYYSARACE